MAIHEDDYSGSGSLSDKDAKIVQRTLTSIREEKGHLASKELYKEFVRRSRPPSSATHHLFEWDMAKGHALYLLERARKVVMEVRVHFVDAPAVEPMRQFRIVTMDGKRGPAPMREIISKPEMMAHVIEEAKASLETWRMRYRQLEKLAELREVFKAVDKATRAKK